MTAREWTLKGHGLSPLSLNDRGRRQDRASQAADWRAVAGGLAADRRVPALARAHVTITLRPPRQSAARRRDADNYVATLKPIVDGLVDAGVVPDDTPDYVTWAPPAIGEASILPYWGYVIVVREVVA